MFHTCYTIALKLDVQVFGGAQDMGKVYKGEKILATEMGQKLNSQRLLAET